jgi:hypothetical protein
MFDWHKCVGRYLRGHRIVACTLGVHLVLMGLVCTVVLASRSELAPLDVAAPPHLQPGSVLSDTSSCIWDHDHWTTSMRCSERGKKGTRYYVAYDALHNKVTRIAKWTGDAGIKLGDLILVWGPPISVGSGVVSWGNRSAFALGPSGSSPFDKVHIVTYTLEPFQQDAWRGFVNRRPYPVSIDFFGLSLFK